MFKIMGGVVWFLLALGIAMGKTYFQTLPENENILFFLS